MSRWHIEEKPPLTSGRRYSYTHHNQKHSDNPSSLLCFRKQDLNWENFEEVVSLCPFPYCRVISIMSVKNPWPKEKAGASAVVFLDLVLCFLCKSFQVCSNLLPNITAVSDPWPAPAPTALTLLSSTFSSTDTCKHISLYLIQPERPRRLGLQDVTITSVNHQTMYFEAAAW